MIKKDIFLPTEPITNYAEFIEYWDGWHKEWYEKASGWINSGVLPTPADSIKGWPIPPDPIWRDFPEPFPPDPIWRDFPEPYWGNPCSPKAVFININPGGSGGDLRLPAGVGNTLYAEYLAQGSYSKTITALGGQVLPAPIYERAVNWHNSRATWASNICGALPAWGINDILDLDLVPWQTLRVAGIAAYLALPVVSNLILNKIFIPAIHISNTVTTCFHSNIIGRGRPVQNKIVDPAFAPIVVPPPRVYINPLNNRNRWLVNDLNHSGSSAKCKVYVGGYGGMNFPPPLTTYLPVAPVLPLLPIPYTCQEIITIPDI